MKDNTKERFFSSNQDGLWRLSENGECYTCEKHSYIIVFYNRSHNPLHNEDLLEIKDRKFVDQLKQEFDSNIDIYKNK